MIELLVGSTAGEDEFVDDGMGGGSKSAKEVFTRIIERTRRETPDRKMGNIM